MSDRMSERERLIERLERARRAGAVASPEQREENLRRLIRAAIPPAEVPESLRERVRALEAAPPAPVRARVRPSALRRPLGWAVAAVLAAGVLTAKVLQPTWVAARTLQRMEAAITDARSAHEVSWSVAPDGSRRKIEEKWYQNGKWRIESGQLGRTNLFIRGRNWSYEPKSNTVSIWRSPGPSGYPPSGFSLAARARDFARWGSGRRRDRVHLLRERRLNGRRLLEVAIDWAGFPGREWLLVDAATDFPIRTAEQHKVAGRWVTEFLTEHHYNQPLPERLFRPDFPRSARIVNWEANRQRWERRLAPGIARKRVGNRTIVLRDFQVCAEGDIFVLYTAGRHPGDAVADWSKELTDDQGGKYQNAGLFQPYMEGNLAAPAGPGYVFDGEKLEGYWWVPSAPEKFSLPRRFRLIFHVAPVTHHGSATGSSLRDEDLTQRVTFDLTVKQRTPTVLPDYMPYMAAAPDEWEVHRARVWARAMRSQMAHDLPQALKAYRELLRLSEAHARVAGGPFRDTQLRIAIGDVLQRMGRKLEARAMFQQAVRDSVSPDSMRQEAQTAVQAVERDLAWSPGRKAPSVTGTDLEGRRISTDQYRGRVLLIDLWSRWSHDSPDLKFLDQRYHRRGLALLGVALDVDEAALRRFVREQNLTWPQLFDRYEWRSKIAGRFGYRHEVTTLPRTILVDRRGLVRAVDLHGPALRRAVARLMDEELMASTSAGRRR